MSFTRSHDNWSPLYFLAALGSGGMIVTFFMYLMFWIPHPGQPIPVFEDWTGALATGSPLEQAGIAVAIAGIIFFMFYHLRLVAWNIAQYRLWKANGGLPAIIGKNAHTQLLAIPLTLAMTINAAFIAGALFVPGLWSVVEYLFPFAMLGFGALGVWAIAMYLSFFSHVVSNKQFDNSANNSLAQLMPAFAFAMVGVGMAAPAAMSHNAVTVGASIFFAGLFIVPSLFVTVVKMIIGIGHMLDHGVTRSTLPTLWVGVPIITTLSIASLRIDHGLAHTLGLNENAGAPLLFLGTVIAAQLFLILLGGAVMKRMRYFKALLSGEEQTPVVYALVCPGVAFSVSLQFFINKGLVAAGVLAKFGLAYWVFTGFAIVIQVITAVALVMLVRQLISARDQASIPATA